MSMVERAAIAVAAVRGWQWDTVSENERALFREDAKAVLTAMREDVSRVAYEAFGCCATGRAVSEYMERAIDAALGDEK